jgi:hypothetical protein
MYTYVRCKRLTPGLAGKDSPAARLQMLLEGSDDMSDIDKLGDHSNRRAVIRSILEVRLLSPQYTISVLRPVAQDVHRCSPCADPQSVKALTHCDIFSMCVRTLVILTQKTYVSGTSAQTMLNVLQLVRSLSSYSVSVPPL